MSRYIVNIGSELCSVLKNACAAQPEQFAGYCANLDFWMDELRHLKQINDSYENRLIRMKEARDRFLDAGNRRPQNLDDFSVTYQKPKRTTEDSERLRVVREAMSYMAKFCERGLELGTIYVDDYDQIADELENDNDRYHSI